MQRMEGGKKGGLNKRKNGLLQERKVTSREREICTYSSLLCTTPQNTCAAASGALFNWEIIHTFMHWHTHSRTENRAYYKYPCESEVSSITLWNPWAETGSQNRLSKCSVKPAARMLANRRARPSPSSWGKHNSSLLPVDARCGLDKNF